MNNKNIVAIGGGGFGRSLGSLKIEKFIISLVSKKRPKMGRRQSKKKNN